jgi:hypothetical protein
MILQAVQCEFTRACGVATLEQGAGHSLRTATGPERRQITATAIITLQEQQVDMASS